jgi:hypothetical protein
VSRNLDFEDDQPPQYSTHISCSYNLVGSLISLAQAIYASFTLYQTQGDQVTRYGYAAFGLTVAPFVVMSIINLVGNLLAPNYPALYLVDSSVMAEARKRDGCHLDGVVGKLKEASVAELTSLDNNKVWIQSLSFNKSTSSDQVSVQFYTHSGSASHSSSADETTLLIMEEENAIEMTSQVKESVNVEEQERTHLVLPEPTQKSVSDDDGTHFVLYIPSCPQVSPAPRSKEPTQLYKIEKTAPSQPGIKLSGGAITGASTVFGVLLSLVPIAIVGALSRFQSGSSTPAQRGWIMAWLTSSIVGGFLVSWTHKPAEQEVVKQHLQGNALVGYYLVFGAPAIGGLVAVDQMIREYGTCIQIP